MIWGLCWLLASGWMCFVVLFFTFVCGDFGLIVLVLIALVVLCLF